MIAIERLAKWVPEANDLANEMPELTEEAREQAFMLLQELRHALDVIEGKVKGEE